MHAVGAGLGGAGADALGESSDDRCTSSREKPGSLDRNEPEDGGVAVGVTGEMDAEGVAGRIAESKVDVDCDR